MSFSIMRKITEHMSMAVGLCVAAGIILWFENSPGNRMIQAYGNGDPLAQVTRTEEPSLLPPRALKPEEEKAARIAWTYFETFTNANSGLSNSVENFPSGTLWDQGSYLAGILCAFRLGIVSEKEARKRIEAVLESMLIMPLVEGVLPNKVYNTNAISMTYYNNAEAPNGLGWSALDLARVSVPLYAVTRQFPDLSTKIAQIQTRWRITHLTREGELWGTARDASNNLVYLQEGRLGYEEYGARALALLGLNTGRAADWRYAAQPIRVEGVTVLADLRDKENSNGSNYVLSEPYLLTAFEFGLDPETELLTRALYLAQEKRADRTGILTAVTEDNIDQDPYFLYYSAFANGEKWSPINPDGKAYPELATVSTKAAFGWHALFETNYTHSLIGHVAKTADLERGWLSGVYEVDGRINDVATANTNGMVLLALHYRAYGPLLPAILRDPK
ncbi:MAG: DUF3131 domain-containing protein [Pseudomonadota bacterium]